MFADTHIHLCPALDDGPRTESDVIEMCEQAWNEGIRAMAVTAHQNEYWPNKPSDIFAAAEHLKAELDKIGCDIELSPVGEVVIGPDTIAQFEAGELLTYGNHGKHLLIEYPHGLFLDIRTLVSELVERGVTPVLAHAERYPELRHDEQHLRELISRGCQIQISTTALETPKRRFLATRNSQLATLKRWLASGLVHVIGSDAHSPTTRPVRMQHAAQIIEKWCGKSAAEKICWYNGVALLRGECLQNVAKEQEVSKRWFHFA